MPVSSTAVNLTAAADPISAWVGLVTSALGNATTLGADALADPALLRQFIENQLGYAGTVIPAVSSVITNFANYVTEPQGGLFTNLQAAFDQLTAGNVAGAVESGAQALILLPILTLAAPFLDPAGPLSIPTDIAQNIANVVATLTNPINALPVALGAIGSILGPINALGNTLQAVVDGVSGPVSALNAILSAPAVIAGAAINGYTNVAGTLFPGLLTVGSDPFSMGLVQGLMTLAHTVADAITPQPAAPPDDTATAPALAAAAAPTSKPAATVTLNVTPQSGTDTSLSADSGAKAATGTRSATESVEDAADTDAKATNDRAGSDKSGDSK
jgi:hypothetical protein